MLVVALGVADAVANPVLVALAIVAGLGVLPVEALAAREPELGLLLERAAVNERTAEVQRGANLDRVLLCVAAGAGRAEQVIQAVLREVLNGLKQTDRLMARRRTQNFALPSTWWLERTDMVRV